MAGYDQAKADQINQLAQQYPDYDLNTLAFLSDVPASDVDNYTIDTTGTPATNADYGQATSVQATEPKYDWSTVATTDDLGDSNDNYAEVEPAGPTTFQVPPASPPPAIEPQQPPPTATELSREYTQSIADDPLAAPASTDGLDVYAEDYSVVEPNPVGYERPGLQDDGTIVLDDGDEVDNVGDARDYGSDFDEEDDIDFTESDGDDLTVDNPQDSGSDFDEEDDIEIVENDGDELTADGQDYSVDDDEAEIAAEQDAADAEAQEAANQAQALRQQAQQQQTISAMREASGVKNADGDWRVKLRLAPQATYLYKAANPGILSPLTATDGIIFPYTPQIDVQYRAEYNNYQPTHSNYVNYFYKGSSVQTVQIQADFTAQDTIEAEYLLAVIHFLRSASKMFYGQDAERGSPPPLLYLTGLGEYQFNESPCVISEFNYNLPSDVNYIRARSRQITGADNLQFQKPLATSATNGNFASLGRLSTAVTNAFNGGPQPLQAGAKPYSAAPGNLGSKGATYVPTKMSMTINLLPVATRQQQSQQFSLREYANGNLIKKGMW